MDDPRREDADEWLYEEHLERAAGRRADYELELEELEEEDDQT